MTHAIYEPVGPSGPCEPLERHFCALPASVDLPESSFNHLGHIRETGILTGAAPANELARIQEAGTVMAKDD